MASMVEGSSLVCQLYGARRRSYNNMWTLASVVLLAVCAHALPMSEPHFHGVSAEEIESRQPKALINKAHFSAAGFAPTTHVTEEILTVNKGHILNNPKKLHIGEKLHVSTFEDFPLRQHGFGAAASRGIGLVDHGFTKAPLANTHLKTHLQEVHSIQPSTIIHSKGPHISHAWEGLDLGSKHRHADKLLLTQENSHILGSNVDKLSSHHLYRGPFAPDYIRSGAHSLWETVPALNTHSILQEDCDLPLHSYAGHISHPISESFGALATDGLRSYNTWNRIEAIEEVAQPVAVNTYVERPVPVAIEREVLVPYAVERDVLVEVPHPYPVERLVPEPFPVPVDRPYPVHVEVPHPYPVPSPYPVEVEVPVDRPYPVHVPVPVPEPYPVERKVVVHEPEPFLVREKVPVPEPYPVEVRMPYPEPYPVEVKVPIEQPYPVQVKVPVPEPYPVRVNIPVDKPYPVQVKVPVPEPYPVEVYVPIERPYGIEIPFPVPEPQVYPVEVKVPYPEPYPVKVNVPVPEPYPVEVKVPVDNPYPVYVEKEIPIPKPYPVEVQIPVNRPYPVEIPVPVDRPYPVEVKVPVPELQPYPVQVKIPVPEPYPVEVKVPIQQPYPVYVDKEVIVPKPYPVKVEVPVPEPYPVEVKVPVPEPYPVYIEVPVDRPYPVEVRVPYPEPQPYPVYVEKQVPVPEPYPVEVKVPYPVYVEKPYPVEVEIPVDRPYAVEVQVPVPEPYPVMVEKKIPYPEPYPVEVKIPVPEPQPYPVVVNHKIPVPEPYPVEVKVPYPEPYAVEVEVPVDRPYPVPYPEPYPVEVARPFPVTVEKPVACTYEVEKPVPYPVEVFIDRPFPVPYPVEASRAGSFELHAHRTPGSFGEELLRTNERLIVEPLGITEQRFEVEEILPVNPLLHITEERVLSEIPRISAIDVIGKHSGCHRNGLPCGSTPVIEEKFIAGFPNVITTEHVIQEKPLSYVTEERFLPKRIMPFESESLLHRTPGSYMHKFVSEPSASFGLEHFGQKGHVLEENFSFGNPMSFEGSSEAFIGEGFAAIDAPVAFEETTITSRPVYFNTEIPSAVKHSFITEEQFGHQTPLTHFSEHRFGPSISEAFSSKPVVISKEQHFSKYQHHNEFFKL